MVQVDQGDRPLVERIRQALNERDLDAFGMLLSDDVRWGDDDHPRRCRSRADVLATFSRFLAEGASGWITEIAAGPRGILCGLAVSWSAPDVRRHDRQVFHVYVIRDDHIVEVESYDDRLSAEAAAGLIPGITCAECGCIVDHGVRTFTCGDDECCCHGLPLQDATRKG